MEKTCLLYITNVAYMDMWEVGMDRLKEFSSGIFSAIYAVVDNKELLQNNEKSKIFDSIFIYKNETPYAKRILDVMNVLKNKHDYLVTYHDNNVFTRKLDKDTFINIENFIIENNVDHLRMSRAGLYGQKELVNKELSICKIGKHQPNQYSLYPTLWNINKLITIHEKFQNLNYKSIECRDVHNFTMLNLNNYHINENECNNRIFPSTHIVYHSKWNIHCKNDLDEIEKITKMYNINKNIRGIIFGDPENGKYVENYNSYE